MNDREQLTKMYNDGFNDGFNHGYNKAKGVDLNVNTANTYYDPYGVGYDEGYADAKSEINDKFNHELEQLKIKLEEAERFQAFWRECYHIEHNKLILAENRLKRSETQSS